MEITKERFEAAKLDRVELDQIVELLRERLHRFIASRMASNHFRVDVDDVLQETLLRAYRRFESVEWRGERALFGWLCGISLHVIQEMQRRYLRINNEMPPFEEHGDESTPSRTIRRKERFGRLNESLDKLSNDERRVIMLIRIDGVPLRKVAALMGRSERAVYQLLWRSMKKLKEHFGDTVSLSLSDDRLARETDDSDFLE